MNTFRDAGEEAIFFRQQQITKYTHVYSVALQVLQPVTSGQVVNVEATLRIMEDADFHITHMTGSVIDPVTVDGARYVYDSGLVMLYPMAGTQSRGERGIWFNFDDGQANRQLQLASPPRNVAVQAAQFLSPYDHSMIEFNSVFAPGYGHSWGKPIKFDYTLMRGQQLKISLQNRQYQSVDTRYARVSIAFIGHRYEN